MNYENPGLDIFELQPHAVLNQSAPVQNTWYELLPETNNARVYLCGINVEDVNEDLELKVTIDGIESGSLGLTANHSTTYYAYPLINAISRTWFMALTTTSGLNTYKSFIFEGKLVKIEVRKTTANGAGNLTGIAVYGAKKKA